MELLIQVIDSKLKDTKGGYAKFLSENQKEAKVMQDKEQRAKEIEQSTTKSKSKVTRFAQYETMRHTALSITSEQH